MLLKLFSSTDLENESKEASNVVSIIKQILGDTLTSNYIRFVMPGVIYMQPTNRR